MGWNSELVIATQVVIDGENEGLFIYTGAAGPGNPPVAYGSALGVTEDPYGNSLPYDGGGFVSQVPGVAFAALAAGGLVIGLQGADASVSLAGMVITGSSSGQALSISSGEGPEAGADSTVLGLLDSGAGGAMTLAPDGTPIITDTWHYVGAAGEPAFGAGWSNRGSGWAELAFRKVASPPNSVVIKGWASVSADADESLFTLPSGYRPASAQSFTAWGVTAAAPVQFNIATDGLIGAAADLPDTGNYWIDTTPALDI